MRECREEEKVGEESVVSGMRVYTCTTCNYHPHQPTSSHPPIKTWLCPPTALRVKFTVSILDCNVWPCNGKFARPM